MTQLSPEQIIHIPIDTIQLEGALELPRQAIGLVVFVHGSGSSRFSPRNNFVTRELRKAHVGTLLLDLLTEEEDRAYQARFNINLLTNRLITVTEWLRDRTKAQNLTIGYFGASTGAAAALEAAAAIGPTIGAIVSRGGRPDLAEKDLILVQSPTLLIVGGNDNVVLELNRQAYKQLHTIKQLVVVPGATHLFEEPGSLEAVSQLATRWFQQYLIHEH